MFSTIIAYLCTVLNSCLRELNFTLLCKAGFKNVLPLLFFVLRSSQLMIYQKWLSECQVEQFTKETLSLTNYHKNLHRCQICKRSPKKYEKSGWNKSDHTPSSPPCHKSRAAYIWPSLLPPPQLEFWSRTMSRRISGLAVYPGDFGRK